MSVKNSGFHELCSFFNARVGKVLPAPGSAFDMSGRSLLCGVLDVLETVYGEAEGGACEPKVRKVLRRFRGKVLVRHRMQGASPRVASVVDVVDTLMQEAVPQAPDTVLCACNGVWLPASAATAENMWTPVEGHVFDGCCEK